MRPERKTKLCPFCSEEILADAIKCRYCKEFMEDAEDELPVSRHAVNRQPEKEDKITPLLKRDVPTAPAEKLPDLNLTVTPSIFGLLGSAIAMVFFLAVAAAIMILPIDRWLIQLFSLSDQAAEKVTLPVQILHLVGFAMGFIVVFRFIFKVLALKSIRYDVSADRIEWSRGIFSRKIDNIDMFRVADIKLHRSLLDCILGIGSVTLITKDQTDPFFDFKKVRRPRTLYDVLKTASLSSDRKQGVIHID